MISVNSFVPPSQPDAIANALALLAALGDPKKTHGMLEKLAAARDEANKAIAALGDLRSEHDELAKQRKAFEAERERHHREFEDRQGKPAPALRPARCRPGRTAH